MKNSNLDIEDDDDDDADADDDGYSNDNDDDDNVWLVVPAHCIIETHGAAERAAGRKRAERRSQESERLRFLAAK